MATVMNSSSSSTTSSSTTELATVKLNLPPSLVFLISNIHSFVPIKLESHNYVIWRTQIEHSLKANGFFGYVDGTIPCPLPTATRTTEVSLSDPDIALWTIVDSQLLSCLIATICASTVPLILGLEHAYKVWEVIEHRFNSVSRTYIHDLKRQLYTITKTTTLDAYFDSIKEIAYKLAAAGAPISEEDLVFYAIHGLPTEFDSIHGALQTRSGDLSFEELITMVNAEEMRKNRSQHVNSTASASVFVATSKMNPSSSSSYPPFSPQQSQSDNSQNIPQLVHSQQQPPMFTTSYPQQYNRNWNTNNRPRGYRYQRNGPKSPCQICNKTNHTAKDCYHRSNLNYQPPPFYNTPLTTQSFPQANVLQFYPQNPLLQSSAPNPNFCAPSPSSHAGILPIPQTYFTPSISYPATTSNTQQPLYSHTSPAPPGFVTSSLPSTSTSPGSWFLDSGATNHVTNDLSNLSLQHPYSGNTGVMVGNGNSVPISHTG